MKVGGFGRNIFSFFIQFIHNRYIGMQTNAEKVYFVVHTGYTYTLSVKYSTSLNFVMYSKESLEENRPDTMI